VFLLDSSRDVQRSVKTMLCNHDHKYLLLYSVSTLSLAGFLSNYLDSFVEREAESTSSILSSIAAASVADFKTCSLTA
jgi:hypothetical protein